MKYQNYAVFTYDFFKQELIDKLNTLTPNQTPKWGIMTPQHMVEHLVGSWMISNGRFEVKQITTEEEKTKRLNFLITNIEFDNTLNRPDAKPGELPKLRKKNLDEAIQALKKEIDRYFDFHENHPNQKPVHPIFGPLNMEDWLLFQSKHIKHHLKQFDLMA